MTPQFVDCHSHVVPSGDDGAQTMAQGLALCRGAAEHGTAVLFATPHLWPHLTLTEERETKIRAAYEQMRPLAGLELRLGFELTPTSALLREEPARYALEGTDCVLMEVPFVGSTELVFRLAEHVERAGLRPVIAHPERGEAVLAQPQLAEELVACGCLLQANATSLVGYHGPEIEDLAWQLVERGMAQIVGSDGHRATRPAQLDDAYELVAARLGEEHARLLFDGSVLGVATPSRPASRAASPGV